jgi:hypothetical protein
VKKSTDAADAPVPAPSAAPAPDISGDWKGTFDMNGTPTEMKFHLKSSGGTVTGTLERPGAAPMEVHEGKIDGDTLSFWINSDYEGQTYTIVCKGKITAGQIDFDLATADQSWSTQVTAKKIYRPRDQLLRFVDVEVLSGFAGQRVLQRVGMLAAGNDDRERAGDSFQVSRARTGHHTYIHVERAGMHGAGMLQGKRAALAVQDSGHLLDSNVAGRSG